MFRMYTLPWTPLVSDLITSLSSYIEDSSAVLVVLILTQMSRL